MDSKADHNLHTTLTTAYPQLRKLSLTHPYHTTITISEPVSFIHLYLILAEYILMNELYYYFLYCFVLLQIANHQWEPLVEPEPSFLEIYC